MLRTVGVALLLGLLRTYCEALMCAKCEGDPDVCAKSASTVDCKQFGSDQVCANFFYFNNGVANVQKGCYQKQACFEQQNGQKNHCGENEGLDRPCRCCCETKLCNRLRKGCIVPSKCGKPKKPRIGKFTCPKNKLLVRGDTCDFTCPTDYDQMGSSTTTCVRSSATGKLIWSPAKQACEKLRCKKIFAPENGEMTCTNSALYEERPGFIYPGTECKFKCNKEYKRVGPELTICRRTQKWSNKVPTCVPDPCDAFKKDPNRVDTCTKGRMLGSVCSFKCKVGYKLEGSEGIECVDGKKKKVWDKEPPRCIRVKCFPLQDHPINGTVSCTNNNLEGSVCTFTCDAGYDVDGTAKKSTTTTCADDKDGNEIGEWSHPPATCTRIECRPRLKDPDDGTVDCTATNRLGSVCTYKCSKGYDLSDTTRTTIKSTCEDDGDGNNLGEWSYYPPPTCTKIRCRPPHKAPANGNVKCSDENNVDSICTFKCDEGYDLDDTDSFTYESKCEDDDDGDEHGEWSKKPPTCSPIKCRRVVTPEHSSVTCTDENLIESLCKFECAFGYSLIGEREIICKDLKKDGNDIGEWTEKEPRCRQIVCKKQKHDVTVVPSCKPPSNDMFEVGAVCTYTCVEEGHYLVSYETPTKVERSGSLDVECLETGKWNREGPKCIKVRCPTIKKPQNAQPPTCSDSNWLGSVCGFVCLPTYKLTHTETLTCESDGTDADKIGKWSREPPKCEKNECEPFGQVNNGSITYTNRFKVGSWANLTCNEGYTYKAHEASLCLPAGEDGKLPGWSRQRVGDNICCVTCLFNRRLRLVTVVDKTASRNTSDWLKIITWHYYLLDDLFTKNYDIKFGLVLYDSTVDETYSMSERELTTLADVEDVQFDMHDFPHGRGKKSNTGLALGHTKDTYFRRYSSTTTSRRPGEEPYIIVIKSPGSNDADLLDVAKTISNARIHIMALGFKRDNPKIEEKRLAEITRSDKRVVMVGGISDLTRVSEIVTAISVAKGCSAASRNQECT